MSQILKVKTKTDGGAEFPAAAYAYVPDADKPSTWKLRLWSSPSSKESARQIGMALSALGPGFRGQKVQIPASDLLRVKARVRAAWRKVHEPSEKLPTILKATEGIRFVLGNGSQVQSVIFANDKWSAADAKVWLEAHDLKSDKTGETDATRRFQQEDPSKFETFRVSSPDVAVQPSVAEGEDIELDGEIAKVDEDRHLVFGWASVSTRNGKAVKDRHQDQIKDVELEKMAYRFVLKSRVGGEMHKLIGVSNLVESIAFTEDKQELMKLDLGFVGWWVGFKVENEETWKQVKAGNLKAFSIAGRARRAEGD